jgi:type II secretory pathway pseudopilin PulG
LIPARKSCKNGLALPMLAMETEMKAGQTLRKSAGFTLLELFVVLCVILLLAVLILSRLAPDRDNREYINCINNLKQISLAYREWAGDNEDKFPNAVSITNGGAMELAATGNVAAVFQVMSNELSTPLVLICPQDKKHTAASSFSTGFGNSNISYFVSLDASDKFPQMFLSGDDNFSVGGVRVKSGLLNLATNSPIAWASGRHAVTVARAHFWTPARYKYYDNVVLADGSVYNAHAIISAALPQAIQTSGAATNRLAIP